MVMYSSEAVQSCVCQTEGEGKGRTREAPGLTRGDEKVPRERAKTARGSKVSTAELERMLLDVTSLPTNVRPVVCQVHRKDTSHFHALFSRWRPHSFDKAPQFKRQS